MKPIVEKKSILFWRWLSDFKTEAILVEDRFPRDGKEKMPIDEK